MNDLKNGVSNQHSRTSAFSYLSSAMKQSEILVQVVNFCKKNEKFSFKTQKTTFECGRANLTRAVDSKHNFKFRWPSEKSLLILIGFNFAEIFLF